MVRYINRTHRSFRRGISLLEILISIGVVGIGLLGVVAIIPLAHHKAEQGLTTDRMALAGRRAYRELKVRGFDNPGTSDNPFWVTADWDPSIRETPAKPNPLRRLFYLLDDNSFFLGGIDPNWSPKQFRLRTFCFDPHLVSRVSVINFPAPILETGSGKIHLQSEFETSFPFGGPINNTRIPRVTIRTNRKRPVPGPPDVIRFSPDDEPGIQARIRLLADEMFRFGDDLTFRDSSPDFETDRRLFAKSDVNFPWQDYDQVMPGSPLADNSRAKRRTTGRFSWMATFVPERDLAFVPGSPVAPTTVRKSRDFLMSVVVFKDRILDPTRPNQELLAPVRPLGVSGPAGTQTTVGLNSIQISFSSPIHGESNFAKLGATFDDAKAGNWVAILQRPLSAIVPPITTDPDAIVLKWFKILAVEDLDTAGEYLFTIAGQDIKFLEQRIPNGPPQPIPTFVIFPNRAVAVYEKTVELGSGSDYSL